MLAGMSPQSKGIAAMVLAAALLSAHDAVSKYLAQSYPIGQVVFYRQIGAAPKYVLSRRIGTLANVGAKVEKTHNERTHMF